jgi:hypothetical protein
MYIYPVVDTEESNLILILNITDFQYPRYVAITGFTTTFLFWSGCPLREWQALIGAGDSAFRQILDQTHCGIVHNTESEAMLYYPYHRIINMVLLSSA